MCVCGMKHGIYVLARYLVFASTARCDVWRCDVMCGDHLAGSGRGRRGGV